MYGDDFTARRNIQMNKCYESMTASRLFFSYRFDHFNFWKCHMTILLFDLETLHDCFLTTRPQHANVTTEPPSVFSRTTSTSDNYWTMPCECSLKRSTAYGLTWWMACSSDVLSKDHFKITFWRFVTWNILCRRGAIGQISMRH